MHESSKVYMSHTEILQMALRHQEDFAAATMNAERVSTPLQYQQNHWYLPQRHVIKLNFNATVDKQGNKGPAAVIGRDANGTILDWCYCHWLRI